MNRLKKWLAQAIRLAFMQCEVLKSHMGHKITDEEFERYKKELDWD